MADGTGGAPPATGHLKPGHAKPGHLKPGHSKPGQASPQASAADWITIWQSELAAMATDREMQDSWLRLIDLWAQAAAAAARLLPGTPDRAPDDPARRTGPAPAAGTAAAMAAPDPRDAAIQHLANRVEELERQLRALAARNDDGGPPGQSA